MKIRWIINKKGIEIVEFLSRHFISDNASDVWNSERLNCSRDYIRPFGGKCSTVIFFTEIYYWKFEFQSSKSVLISFISAWEAEKGLISPFKISFFSFSVSAWIAACSFKNSRYAD